MKTSSRFLQNTPWLSIFFIILLVAATRSTARDTSIPRGSDLLPYAKQKNIRSKRAIPSENLPGEPKPLKQTDLILVCTLDGSIRGVDRLRGAVYWTLQGSSGSSLIKTSSHFDNRYSGHNGIYETNEDETLQNMETEDQEFANDMSRQPEDETQTGPIDFSYGSTENDTDTPTLIKKTELQSVWQAPEGHDVYYIVEPNDGGTLYLYKEDKPLEKIPFSVKTMVDQSPFRTRDGRLYIGSKNTFMLAIDPRAGKILKMFDMNQSEDAHFVATQKKLPPHTIYVGRHEYKVVIYDEHKKMWSVTYSEYLPNKLDFDTPVSTIPSDIYVAPGANGEVTAFDMHTGGLLWTHDLPFPVATVFDVYHRDDFTIALSKQGTPSSLHKGTIGQLLGDSRLSTAYVGVHEGSLYALSTERFPLAHIADWAPIYTGLRPGERRRLIGSGTGKNEDQNGSSTWDIPPKAHRSCYNGWKSHADCIVGQHVVTPVEVPSLEPLLLPGSPEMEHLSPQTAPLRDNQSEQPSSTSEQAYNGFSVLWKTSILIIATILYASRHRASGIYNAYISPKIIHMVKKLSLEQPETRPAVTVLENSDEFKTDQVDEKEGGSETEVKSSSDTTQKDAESQQPSTSLIPTPSTGLDLKNFTETKPNVLNISDTVLGYGSHGTVVYKGEFDGRAVAVKRLLIDFYDVALQEVKLLQESDDHVNVVRYFYKEESDRFLYIALELCYGSLHDYMERSLPVPDMKLFDQMDMANILCQITCGIQHLHSLKIVHRDIKPHNILLAPNKRWPDRDSASMRILISDFGLCKKLDGDQSSFHYTAVSPAGTTGWRAPELLAGALAAAASDTSVSNKSQNGRQQQSNDAPVKATRAVDIFSAGCVFYYVLSGGDHPFGDRFGREGNILKSDYDLSKLDNMGEDGVEATDLIESMICAEPRSRPTADVILAHPFFWSPAKRLGFLQDVSDRFEVEQRDPPSPLLQRLEANSAAVIGNDWYRRIDRVVANDLGKFRKYDGKRVRDLLRALRNKKHHWQDLPDAVKRTFGEPPDNYLYYFTARFPRLLLHTYHIVANDRVLTSEGSLRQYF
ncbi:bifunctional endoribonuclease/protein kinase ire1 [Apophysomyces sp. BC1034]|nr:bifunctional endoribonuclease/protein kinase ire1 [Apophysomyces sp. BC1015]KAG0181313.1 bifunctional endoribonuclease/protein kinase ire1 [Apophysomyces sp. BC1021]KAG0189320.1 bifunctional endoribonuclease/protein kinase ire1 [Apophysomyces sp. BC1034]